MILRCIIYRPIDVQHHLYSGSKKMVSFIASYNRGYSEPHPPPPLLLIVHLTHLQPHTAERLWMKCNDGQAERLWDAGGLCSEGHSLLLCGALKRAAFGLLKMPQVIVFLLKVFLQETFGMLSALGLSWGKGGGIKRCCCAVPVSFKTVNFFFFKCIIRIS